jgi:hypothetical protein
MTTENTNPLGMSDEDFLNMVPPSSEPKQEQEAAPAEAAAEDEEQQGNEGTADTPAEGQAAEGTETDGTSDTETGAAAEAEDEGAEGDEGKEAPKDPSPASGDTKAADGAAVKAGEGGDKGGEKKAEPKSNTNESPNYQAFYEQIMTPFKANGRTIELKSPEEAIQLMQMGANYTKKMQDIQPHRKVLMMLQNNDLLDEGKLSFAIDLVKKDPEAIKKLVKDAGIDPMDIDTTVEPSYTEGNHTVSDEEARFRETLEDVTSSESGKETLQTIDRTWDPASKEALWKSPEIMAIMHQQREAGVYDVIAAEVERQRTLGKIPANTPFLQAYKDVGEQLTQAGAFGTPTADQSGKPERQKIGEKVAAPKPKVTNGDKASAAAPTRSAGKPAHKIVNPLSMSDDEFMNSFKDRL